MLNLSVRGNIVLRTYSPEDAPTLFHTVDANRNHLRRWFSWVDATRQAEHSLSFILKSRQEQEEQNGLALGIFHDGQLAGGIGMHDWDHSLRKAAIGYWLAREAEGKGIMHQCARTFIAFLFDSLHLNKLEIHHLPDNTRSAKTAQLLGFRTEGVLRDHLLINGSYHDMVVTGLLRREWTAKI